MTTLHKELIRKGFDFGTGRIIFHPTIPPGAFDAIPPSWCDRSGPACTASVSDSFMHADWDKHEQGYLGCPRFIAEDNQAIYFPAQYNGKSWVEKIYKNIGTYLEGEDTPYF